MPENPHGLHETVYHRQLDLLSPDKTNGPITVIGAGGIGSVTSLCLSKIGCSNLTIYDPDTVEIENIPSQFYTPEHVGHSKVNALYDMIYSHTLMMPTIISEAWDGDVTPIMISAVDSMAVRKEIYQQLKTQPSVQLYIEARMGAEKMRIYTLTPFDTDQQKFYESTLYDDSAASDELCTAKAIAYNTFVIGGIIASLVKKYLMHQPIPRELIFNLDNYSFLKGKELTF